MKKFEAFQVLGIISSKRSYITFLIRGLYNTLLRSAPRMGFVMSMFGTIDVETPPYETVLSKASYEVRAFPRLLAIECPCNDESGAFRTLAGYIGVMGKAQNEASQPIAMTAPVVNKPSKTMQFILPAAMQTAPPPLAKNVTVVERPPSRWAVATWQGGWDDAEATRRMEELIKTARADGVQLDEGDWEWHRYNPPWTLYWWRTNSVAVKVVSGP